MTVDRDSFVVARDQIAQLAAEAFTQHHIELVHTHPEVTVYRCGRVGSGIYAFRVVLLPFTLVFYGDLGEGVFRVGAVDPLSWLRGAVGSPNYLIEKMQPQPAETFYKSDAHAWLDEREDELAEEGLAFDEENDLREILDDEDSSSLEFAQALSQAGLLDGRVPGVKPSATTLWIVEALRWFVAHVDREC